MSSGNRGFRLHRLIKSSVYDGSGHTFDAYESLDVFLGGTGDEGSSKRVHIEG